MKTLLSHTSLLASIFLAQAMSAQGPGTIEKPRAASAASQWTEEPKTPETGAWLAHRIVSAQINDKADIAKRLMEMLRAGNVTAPCAQDGVFFFTKRGPGEKQASIYRRKGLTGTDERVIDAAKLGAKNPALTIFDLSKDGSLLAYGVGEGKAAERTVHFFDVNAGTDLSDVLASAHYNTVSVSPDKKGAWYAKVEPAGTRIFFRTFGAEAAADKLIFGETYFFEALGPKDLISTEVTPGGHHLLLSVRRGAQAKRIDVYAQELDEPDQKIRAIIHAMDNNFSWVARGGDLFVLTDNEAPKQRVVKVKIEDPHPLKWEIIVPQGEDPLTGIDVVGEKLFVTSTHAGAAQTRILNLDGKETGQVITPRADFAQRVFHRCGTHD